MPVPDGNAELILRCGSILSYNGIVVALLATSGQRVICSNIERKSKWAAQMGWKMVVAGHKKTGVPDSPSAIQETKRYLEDFDRLQKTAASDRDLFDQMTALYPDWVANQSWLMFGFPGG